MNQNLTILRNVFMHYSIIHSESLQIIELRAGIKFSETKKYFVGHQILIQQLA